MRHAAVWLVLWIATFWLWQLFSGDWNRFEWIAGACAATVAASVGEYARTQARTGRTFPLRLLGAAGPALAMVPVDFALLMWALPRRRRGRLRETRLPAGTNEGSRAWLAYAANFSPNALVVEIDRAERRVVLHELVPNEASSSPL